MKRINFGGETHELKPMGDDAQDSEANEVVISLEGRTMDIYKIIVKHFSQKDSHTSIEVFLLAESDEAVYQWVDKEKCYGMYTDRNEEDELFDVYDDDYNVVDRETFKERMLRLGGQYFDEDYEPQDLYYGDTVYGWEKLESEMIDAEIDALKKLGILIEV